MLILKKIKDSERLIQVRHITATKRFGGGLMGKWFYLG
jgi:hypothetical protein